MTPAQMFYKFGQAEEIRFVTGDNVETISGPARKARIVLKRSIA